jgi:hypothetical protein
VQMLQIREIFRYFIEIINVLCLFWYFLLSKNKLINLYLSDACHLCRTKYTPKEKYGLSTTTPHKFLHYNWKMSILKNYSPWDPHVSFGRWNEGTLLETLYQRSTSNSQKKKKNIDVWLRIMNLHPAICTS